MKKLLIAAFAIAALLPIGTRAQVTATAGTARVMVYAGQNPDTNEYNLAPRFNRLGLGTFMRDVFNASGLTGAWNGINVLSTTGLYVTINPSPSSQLGSIYQMGVDDASALPPSPGQAPNQIPADNTRIMIQATQAAATSALGPFPAPGGSGNGTYYIVEAQLSPADTANQSMLFVSTSGITSYQNVNTQRQDQITYQIGANTSSGTANCTSTFPSQPTVDSGWIEVALVCIPHGLTQLTSSYIAMFTNTQFNASSFGLISFGGDYAQSGGTTPSTLSTTQNTVCGLSDGLGFIFNNPASTNNAFHLFASSKNGNIGICGSNIHIFNQESNTTPASIIVETPLDTGTSTIETLYPAVNTIAETLSGTCAANSICAVGTTKDICGSLTSFTASAAMIAISGTPAYQLVAQQVWEGAGTGIQIQPANISTSNITGSPIVTFHYVCL